MTQEIERWDVEEWLQENKDIWNHPMVTDRTDSNGYEVADLMAEFANYVLSKQQQKQLIIEIMNEDAKDGLYKQQTAVEWLKDVIESFGNKHELQMSWNTMDEIIQQAKEMEKDQLSNAFYKDRITADVEIEKKVDWEFEEYYQKTYGGNK